MRAFDFVLLFFSFIYALALAHLLQAAARMIRHRRTIVFSAPHALWMLLALLFVVGNWISQWDFHTQASISAMTIASGFAFSVLVYLVCALVTPDINVGGTTDLQSFHATEGRTYMGAALVAVLAAIAVNLAAGGIGVQNFANENGITAAMLVPVLAALFVRAAWVQVAAPLLLGAMMIAYIVMYYPVLR